MKPPLEFNTFYPRGYESLGELREMGLDGPGIYVLHFSDGTQYVGRTDDAAKRTVAHMRAWDQPIVSIDFAEVPHMRTELHEVVTILERQAAGVKLMNELHNKTVPMRPDGIPVRDPEKVEGIRWALLASEEEVAKRPPRARKPTGSPSPRVLSAPAGAEVLRVLASYVGQVLRCPADTEWTYWRLWTPARRPSGGDQPLARLTVRKHDLLHVRQDANGLVYVITMLHRSSELDPDYRAERGLLRQPTKEVKFTALDSESFCRAIFQDPDYLAGARALAHETMTEGPTKSNATHDWALADAIFSALPITFQEIS